MLEFFRKYQKSVLIVMTIVVVSSFAFYGTYQVMAPVFHKKDKGPVVFKTIHGHKIYEPYFQDFARFLTGEGFSMRQSRSAWAFNYLNDSIIQKEFLKTGIAYRITQNNPELYTAFFQEKIAKEKHFKPYRHPTASAMDADLVWKLFAPTISDDLKKLQTVQDPLDEQAFKTRVDLFLAEQQFPPALLSQVLRYQEKENPSIQPDTRLLREDLSLFNYRSMTDWFGESLIKSITCLIINGAELAREKGYSVTDEEVMTEVICRCQKILESMKETPDMTPYQFFIAYIHHAGMDEATCIAICKDITLFKRLMRDIGNMVVLDDHPMKSIYACAHQNATVELYQLPELFRFKSYDDLRLFEAYLQAVAAPGDSLVPSTYNTLEAIEKKAPELTLRQYTVEIASLQKKDLLARVGLKEMWEWEVEAENWKKLQCQFPELESISLQDQGNEKEARFKSLDALNPRTRKNVDNYAKEAIIAAKQLGWIEKELQSLATCEKQFFDHEKSMHTLFPAISRCADFLRLLDEKKNVDCYTEDGNTYYKVIRKNCSEKKVLTYSEALNAGLLEEVVKRLDEAALQKTIETLAKILEEEHILQASVNAKTKQETVACYRFYPLLCQYPASILGPLAEQWKLIKKEKTVSRANAHALSVNEVLATKVGGFSQVRHNQKDGLYYYRVVDKKIDTSLPLDKMLQAQEILAQEAKRNYFNHLLELSQSEMQALCLKK